MINKKKFSEAIKDDISVVEELLKPLRSRQTFAIGSEETICDLIKRVDKLGIYNVIGRNASNPLTDWGRLIAFSHDAALFIGLNFSHKPVFLTKSGVWRHSINNGDDPIIIE